MVLSLPSILAVVGTLAVRATAQHGPPSGTPTTNGTASNSTAAKGAPSGSAAAAHGPHAPTPADMLNEEIRDWILYTWAAILVVLIVHRGGLFMVQYIRTVACLNNDTQHYFRRANRTYGSFKRYLFDSPLFRLRHNREFKLSSAINIGTLPTRFQAIFIVGFLIMNATYCGYSIDWFNPKTSIVLGQLRNRTGVLATINMIPLVILAGRNNPLIKWTGITFDTYNLIHRWLGRIVVLEAIVHTFAYLVNKANNAGWASVPKSLANSQFLYTGLIVCASFLLPSLRGKSREKMIR